MIKGTNECPHCGGTALYGAKDIDARGGMGPDFLPNLGSGFTSPKFEVVVCSDCGLARFFVQKDARARIATSSWWKKLENT